MEKALIKKRIMHPILIWCTSIIFLLVLTVTSIYIITYKSLKYNYYLGNIVSTRVTNAQYLPNVSLMSDDASLMSGSDVLLNAAQGITIGNTPILSVEDCSNMVSFLGNICTDDQAGIENGFQNVTTVKDELFRILAVAPAFDTWFAEGAGFQGLFRGNAYCIHYNENTEMITINCVSIATDTGIIEYANQNIIHSYYFGPILRQFMEINYYYNEEGIEVVEMYIYNTLIYKNKTYPIAYQYIKNVRDTSFTKVYILSNIRTRPTEAYKEDYAGAHDLDNNNPYGAIRSFIQLDYSNNNAISLLMVDQSLPTFYSNWPATTYVRLYNKIGDDRLIYSTAYDYANEQNIFLNSSAYRSLNYDTCGDILFNSITQHRSIAYRNNYMCGNCAQEEGICEHCDHFISDDTVQRQNYFTNDFFDDSDKIDSVYNILLHNITKAAYNIGVDEELINDYKNSSNKYYIFGNFIFENEFDDFIDTLSINFIDKFTLRDRGDDILKEYKKSKIIDIKASVSAISAYISINDDENVATIENGLISFSIKGKITPSILLKKDSEYSLSLIIQDGNYSYILADCYVNYEGAETNYDYSGVYDFNNLIIEKQGNYKLAIALTQKLNEKEYIVSDLSQITLSYEHFNIADTQTGYQTSYTVYYQEGNMYIRAIVNDKEPPEMLFTGVSKILTFEERPMAGTLFNYYKISDNEMIKSMSIYDSENKLISWRTLLDSGSYTIIIVDINGNSSEDTLTVIINE